MTETEIACQIYACVNQASNSADKRRILIELPELVSTLARDIHAESYRPGRMTAFAVQDPKLREILAPDFRDRIAQQWLVSVTGLSIERQWIDDCYSNRVGKGTHSAINRLQHFMRMPAHSHYCQMDVRSFFPSINRRILLDLWTVEREKLPYAVPTLGQLDAVARQIILQNPINPKPAMSGDLGLLRQIPAHYPHRAMQSRSTWTQWLMLHQLTPPLAPHPLVLKRMLATLNSYYGQLIHANSYHLRRKIYHEMLGPIKRYFLPTDASYGALRIKPVWLFSSP